MTLYFLLDKLHEIPDYLLFKILSSPFSNLPPQEFGMALPNTLANAAGLNVVI